jgi:lipopolysaccharide/colanic/teichoic acid biosynthesis glycosyltransferase
MSQPVPPFPFADEKSRQESFAGKIKRVMDFTAAIIAFIIASPLLILLAIVVRLFMGAPILFRQPRPGFRETIFTCYKFRTMNDKKDEKGNLLPDADRLTWLGKMMRKLSLDELPQLINVLKGDQSLVGPRPLLISYIPYYEKWERRRHLAVPGITGWAQIHGRNSITWEQKFTHDVYYVDHWSLWLDLKILFLTPWMVLKGEGVNQPGRATFDKFDDVVKARIEKQKTETDKRSE